MDPNVYIQDKVGTCDIRPGRRPRGRDLTAYVADYRRRAGVDLDAPDGRRHGLMSSSLWGRLDDVTGRRGLRRPPAADGLLHRHLRVHRLQGLRGGLQGVEPGPRRRLRADRHVLRQHPGARREHLAARRVRREAACTRRTTDLGLPGMGPPGWDTHESGLPSGEDQATASGDGGHPVADVLRRLQALHARGLPRRVPDRVAVPHRVRHRRRPARHLQRLRLLRAGLSRTA